MDRQGLEFGKDDRGPDQAVAGGGRGVRLQPTTDGEDGSLQFGRDVLSDVVVGPRQVVETVGPGLQGAAPPLVEPDFGAADGGADGLDGPAGEAQGNGSMTSREFVVHGYLREAAAGGCPRGEFYAGGHPGRFPVIPGFLGQGCIGDTGMPRKAGGGEVKKAGHPTRRVRYSVAMSLDGFIAGPNGEADWIIMDPSSEAEIDFKAMYSRFDTIVMGRRTYEVAKAAGGGGSTPDMQVFVFSRTLRQEDHPGVTIVDDPEGLMAELRSKAGEDVWLWGGGSPVTRFGETGLGGGGGGSLWVRARRCYRLRESEWP